MQNGMFLLVFVFVEEVLSTTDQTSERILIKYDGTPDEAREFGKTLGLEYEREVLSKYEFKLKPWVTFEELEKSHPELRPKKVTTQKRVKRAVTVSDAQWSNQWHLQTSQSPGMNVYNAWDKGFTGSGVTIAIVDDGIDIDHSDLVANYDSALSYDYIYNHPDPSHVDAGDGHGTNCAGVAGAVKNTVCVIGVAYEATIPAIRILDQNYGATDADEALALTHELSSIDIYSNSWGPSDDGTSFSELSSIQEEALEKGVNQGRGGKGAIYTWASGNGGANYDDCNADSYASSIYTIAIAAVSETTAPTWYSEHCTAILAGTYSGDYPNAQIATTGPANTCVNNFSGTSSACPVASGICALTLQANSALTWRDIQHMIVEYSISSGLHSNASFYTNGVGKEVSHWFGFGLMDAEAMVDNAPSWSTVPSSTSCTSTKIGVYSSSVSTDITSTYNSTQCYIGYLEHVVVTISYKASFRGDVEFYLDSPSGTQTKIFSSRYYDSASSEITWDFMSVHTWGEDPEGEWTLTMSDAYGGTSMELNYWKIKFYGTVTDPLAGEPAAGALGGSCTDSNDCSGLTDGGCLDDGKICVVCNNGYRVLSSFCKQDGRLDGYCDNSITCAPDTLECSNNLCKEKQSEDDNNAGMIAGAVVGTLVGVALLVAVVYMVYKVFFVSKATASVAPSSSCPPPAYSSYPPPYPSQQPASTVSGTDMAFSGSHAQTSGGVPGPTYYSNPAV